jgi:hypothetical protein
MNPYDGDSTRKRLRRQIRVALAIACVAISASGCFVAPATSVGDYRNKAANSAEAMVGFIASASRAAQLDLQHRSGFALTDDVVTDAEGDAGSVVNAFDSRQPPNEASSRLKDEIDDPLDAASSGLTDLRIAVRRGDVSAIRSALVDLAAPDRKLERLESTLS